MALPGWIFKDRSLGYKFALLAIVPVIIVTLFIVLVTTKTLERQMIEKTRLRAKGLIRLSVLSVSNSFVIYNKDLLNNFVDNLWKEEIVTYAMVVDSSDNRILAHSNHFYDGKVYDESEHSSGPNMDQSSSELVPDRIHGEIFELSAPVLIRGIEYGVVRIGFSLKTIRRQIAEMKNNVITMALFAIALGVFCSILLARIISKPIKGLAKQAEMVGAGSFEQRMIYDSKDALGQLASSFNDMAEKLKANIGMLEENEAKYRALFEYSPISLWEEDLSEVKTYLDGLRSKGVEAFRQYFDDHPEEISPCINRINILDVNRATVELYEAQNKQAFLGSLRQIRTKKTHEILINGVIALAEGKPVEIEAAYKTLTGEDLTVLIKSTIPPGYENTWSKVFISVQDLTERVRAEFLEEMFGRYISRKVMNTLIEDPDSIKLGGEKRGVTIMMSDLRGFTALSERLEPEQVVQMLNTYLEVMVNIIREYDGTIIEIIGDALLVLFGAPQEIPDRNQRAIACAIAMQNAMAEVTARNRKHRLPELEMGIALNEADVVVGNIGSKKRSKYGVVGSGVNMTGRIESYAVGGQILISESVRKEAGDLLRLDDQMVIHPKGAEAPVTVYEVGGIGGQYNLALEDKRPRLFKLAREIPIRYAVLDGKYVGQDRFTGSILQLSRKSGELRLQTELARLTNLRLNLANVGDELSGKDFYAKVVERSETDPNTLQVRFTALPPRIDAYFQAAISQGGQENNGSH